MKPVSSQYCSTRLWYPYLWPKEESYVYPTIVRWDGIKDISILILIQTASQPGPATTPANDNRSVGC